MPKARLAGSRFVADDSDWRFGDGDEVCGPSEALAMTIAGRTAYLGEIGGPGAAALRERIRGD